jgi:hypothetical protein
MVNGSHIAFSLISMFSGAFVESAQQTEVQDAGPVESRNLKAIQAENQCAASALAKILYEVRSPTFPRDKWRINLEVQRSSGRATTLSVDVEPIDLSPGGGGRFTYDCESGRLTLIEDFR